MTAKRPSFMVRNNNTSAYFFRSTIPKDLRDKFDGIREFRFSLKTGIKSEAQRYSYDIKKLLERRFYDIRCGNISESSVNYIKVFLMDYLEEQLLPEF